METQTSSLWRGTKVFFFFFFLRRREEDIDCWTATDEAARPGMLSPVLKNIM